MRPIFVPIVAGLIAWAAARFFDVETPSNEDAVLASIGGTVTAVAATMLGFLLASLAILASINHTHLVAMMRKYGHYENLLATIFIGCVLFLLCALFGYALVLWIKLPHWYWPALLALHGAALASLLDIGRKLWFTLTSLRSA